MTNDITHAESGGISDGATPTAQAAPHTETSQPDGGAGDMDDQGVEVPASDGNSKLEVDHPSLTKPTHATDAYLVTEKTPEQRQALLARVKESGFKLQDYIDMVADTYTSKEIYELWAAKLRKHAESYEKGQASERTPRLARSFIDYVGTVDHRLQKIESKIGITSTETKRPEEAPGEKTSVQTRFYNASAQDHSRSGGLQEDEPGWNVKGNFLSEVDSKHCLRVLFNWVQDRTASTEFHPDDEHPDPKSIEISEIRIHSDPVTTFLANKLDYEVHKDSVIRLKRPFRSLIREVDSIKKQLSVLESQYRYLDISSSLFTFHRN